MKILVIGHIPKEYGGNFTTGVGNVVINLNLELSKAVEVDLLATNVNPATLFKSKEIGSYRTCSIFGWQIFRALFRISTLVKELRFYNRIYGVRTIKSILYRIAIESVCNKYKPDLIHFHGINAFPSFIYANIKIPHVVTYHGVFYQTEHSYSDQSGLNTSKLYYETSKYIKASTFLNTEMEQYAIKKLSFKNMESRVIANGVNIDSFYYDSHKREEVRRRLSIKKEEKLLITVGTIQKRKGQKEFIKKNLEYFD